MSSHSKYRLIAADTFEERKRHRTLIELALKTGGLSPELRLQLEWALKRALIKEGAALETLEGEDAEEDKGKGGDDGNAGGNASGSASSSSGGESGGIIGGKESEDQASSEDDIKIITLLFFLAEQDLVESGMPPAQTEGNDVLPLATATLLFNRNEYTAQVTDPYQAEMESAPHSPSDFLPSLEQHAAQIGARELHVQVHPDSVAHFQNKLGYKPYGRLLQHGDATLQRMSKPLNHPMLIIPDEGG